MSDSIVKPELAHVEGDDPLDLIVAECLDSGSGQLATAIDSACRANPSHAGEIRRRVEALRAAGLLRNEKLAGDESFPERLGDFRLLRRLGGGGMGVVFRARQESLGREVALKLIRPEHMYFPRARERFRRETEAVARLQHPGIVPIYTVGEEQGLPYFAMELVAGCTLGEVVKELQGRAPESLNASDLREALLRSSSTLPDAGENKSSALFEGTWVDACLALTIQVARALHHAHGRGVLHRDVKPSNIALTFDGRPLLLDFGLASLEADVRVTAQGSALGSLLYMSPEQIRGDSTHVDQRSDVYALGVTLYELLTLQAPYYDTNPVGTRQAIIEGRADAIRARNRAVPKDLETVCFKAMERDPARRYADAESFARDLSNVRELRPIEARPPSSALRVRRWVQRNPAKSVALALGCTLVLVTPSALLWQQTVYGRDVTHQRDAAIAAKKDADEQRAVAQAAQTLASKERDRARSQARESESVANFMVDLFGAADPANARGRDLTAREMLDLGLERVDADLADEPDVQAKLLDRMGHSYASLGIYDKAEPLIERAMALRREHFGEESLEYADSLMGLAHFERIVGRKGSVEHARRAVELRRQLEPERDAQLAQYLVGYAMALVTVRDFEPALAAYDEAREIEGSLDGDQRRLRSLILTNLANAYYNTKRYEDAVTTARESIALEREMDPTPHPALTSSLNTLALSLKYLKRFDEARAAYDELLAAAKVLQGEENDRYATFLLNKAALVEDMGDRAAALELLERAWGIFQRVVSPSHPQAITCLGNLAGLYARTAQWGRARTAYVDVIPRLIDSQGEASSRVVLARQNLAMCYEAAGDWEHAEDTFREALESAQQGDESSRAYRVERVQAHLARVLFRRGDVDGARELANEARTFAQTHNYPTVGLLARFAGALIAIADGDAAGAETELTALSQMTKDLDEIPWLPAAARGRLAALVAAREPTDAGELADSALRELEAQLGPAHPETLVALDAAITAADARGDAALASELRGQRTERTSASYLGR